MDLVTALQGSAPLVILTMALVEFVKRVGITGTPLLTASSVLIGLALGLCYQMSVAMPASFGAWFGAVLYGLAIGLSATGIYKVGQSVGKA